MNRISLLTLLLTATFVCYSSLRCQVNYYAPDNIYLFAEHLFQDQDYLRAAGEYQRYAFSVDGNSLDDSLLLKIGRCYQLGDRPDRAIDYYQRAIERGHEEPVVDKAQFLIAQTFFEQEEYDKSIEHIQSIDKSVESTIGRLRINQLLGLDYLKQHDWEAASIHFSSLAGGEGSTDSLTTMLNALAFESTSLPRKNPLLAGVMSTILPGTGKFYVGRSGDAIYSLISITLMGWQSYDGFDRDGKDSVKGWVYASIGTIFYLGNIYGSAVAARLYNRKVEDDFLAGIDFRLTWR